jgi:hypothetical protein
MAELSGTVVNPLETWQVFDNSTFPFTFQYPQDSGFVCTANIPTQFSLVIPKYNIKNSNISLLFI